MRISSGIQSLAGFAMTRILERWVSSAVIRQQMGHASASMTALHRRNSNGTSPKTVPIGAKWSSGSGVLERAMGIEPVANLLSPVESVGLTLLEDLIWASKRGDFAPKLRPNLPIAQNFGRWERSQRVAAIWAQLGGPHNEFDGQSDLC